MKNKTPIELQAAALLEMRSRQRERGVSCQMCALLKRVSTAYGSNDDGSNSGQQCQHTVDQRNGTAEMFGNIVEIYGDNSNETHERGN